MLCFIGSQEFIIIAVVLVLLFGSKKIPDLIKGMKEVKKVKDDIVKETKIVKDIKNIKDTLKF